MEELITGEKIRRDYYRILADCYYQPDERLIETLNGLSESGSGSITEAAKMLVTGDSLETLQIDYSRLFVGPFGLLAPPYGSLYLENNQKLMGDSTLDAKRRYAEEGLILESKDAPDHIAIELEFLYFLIHREIEASLGFDILKSDMYIEKQKSFLETHLGRWVFDFTQNIVANARTEFYRELALTTSSFIREDLKNVFNISSAIREKNQVKSGE